MRVCIYLPSDHVTQRSLTPSHASATSTGDDGGCSVGIDDDDDGTAAAALICNIPTVCTVAQLGWTGSAAKELPNATAPGGRHITFSIGLK